MHGASTGRLPRRKMNSFAFTVLPNTAGGIGHQRRKTRADQGTLRISLWEFSKIHRCGVLSAENRAGQYQHYDIENAVAHLHGMLDARKGAAASKRTRGASPGKTARGARHSAR